MKSTLAISAVIFTIGFVTLPIVFSDNDFEWREHEEHEYRSDRVAGVNNPQYKEECGSCHMAYPPGLLPAASWSKMMESLDDHFGDNAELDADTYQAINNYLVENSAGTTGYRQSKKFLRKLDAKNPPLRISELSYFRHEHDEIPDRMVKNNPEVLSYSNCNACHARAEQGSFNEHDIKIPGYGRWDD